MDKDGAFMEDNEYGKTIKLLAPIDLTGKKWKERKNTSKEMCLALVDWPEEKMSGYMRKAYSLSLSLCGRRRAVLIL